MPLQNDLSTKLTTYFLGSRINSFEISLGCIVLLCSRFICLVISSLFCGIHNTYKYDPPTITTCEFSHPTSSEMILSTDIAFAGVKLQYIPYTYHCYRWWWAVIEDSKHIKPCPSLTILELSYVHETHLCVVHLCLRFTQDSCIYCFCVLFPLKSTAASPSSLLIDDIPAECTHLIYLPSVLIDFHTQLY